MIRVTYIGHSGFLVEWPEQYWLFDYYNGTLPPLLPSKPLLVFASHRHADHFNPAIFRLPHPDVRYILSKDIRLTERKREEYGVPEGAEAEIAALFAGEHVIVHKRTKRGETDLDIRPLITRLELRRVSEQELELECVVTAMDPALNPQLLATAIETHLPAMKPDFSVVHRVEVFDAEMQPFR